LSIDKKIPTGIKKRKAIFLFNKVKRQIKTTDIEIKTHS